MLGEPVVPRRVPVQQPVPEWAGDQVNGHLDVGACGAAGAGILRWSPVAALAIAAVLVAAVAGAFLTAIPAAARGLAAPRPVPAAS